MIRKQNAHAARHIDLYSSLYQQSTCRTQSFKLRAFRCEEGVTLRPS